jgi:hypothetical protein
MPNRKTSDSNIFTLPHAAGREIPSVGRTSLGSAHDPRVAEGMRLVRSFMAIEDAQTRASILRIVEEIADHSPLFKK